MIQEHIPPASKGYFTKSERAQHLAKLLEDEAKLEKSFLEEEEKVSKARLAVSQAEDDLSILQQEMKGLPFQIDAHHREDDARREKNQGRDDDMEGVFVEEADSGEEVGVHADGGKSGKLARVGSAVVRALRELALITLWSSCVGCRRRTRSPLGGTMGRMEVTMCPLLRVINLKSVFVFRIRLKRRVFKVFKP